jgi:hypothetical protein
MTLLVIFLLSILWDSNDGVGRGVLGEITRNLPEKWIIDYDSLTLVSSQLVYWFAWTGVYPETDLY